MPRGCRVAMFVAAVLAACPAPSARASAHAPARASAPALDVRIQDDPLRIEFVDTKDGDVLRSAGLSYTFDLREPVVNNAYLGYYVAAEVQTVTFHAIKVESRQGDKIVAATDDPQGNKLEIELKRFGDGAIALEAHVPGDLGSRVSLSATAFEAGKDERYLGFGSRSNAADQTGNHVFNWAEEGPFSSGDGEVFTKNIPDFTFPTGPTATNFPIPWLVSTRGFGVLIDKTERSYFNLLNERADAWDAQVEAPAQRLVIFAGPHPADVVRRYSDYAGRQPKPEPWFFGPWFQPTLETKPYELAERFRREDVPVTLAQTYTHYLPCGAQKGKEKDERERVARYHALGYRITTYFNPHVCLDYHEAYDKAAANGWLVKNQAGEPYVLSNPFTADEQVSEIDFTIPAARSFFQQLLAEAVANGYDGWMEDFGEYTPTDSVFGSGESGRVMHNRYPVLYHQASTETTGERAVFIRSGYHGVQRYARAVWGGDPTEDWSCADGLCAAMHQAIAMGLSGVAYQGSDIGGFHSIANGRTDDELNIRWLELGAVSGIMRTQANGFTFRRDKAKRSQVWSPAVYPRWRRYSKLRTQLYPYIAAASDEYQRSAMPIVRHLSLAYPADPKAVVRQDEFMFGPDLLVAPVVEEGARERKLYLPAGRWVELWRGVRYDRKTGGLRMVRAGSVEGGRELKVRAPVYELPMFVRAGAVVPLLPSDVDSLSGLGAKGVVDLRDRRGSMSLLAFPRGRSTAAIYAGERIDSREGVSRWTLRFHVKRTRAYRLQASLRTLEHPFRPCAVRLDGRPVAFRWFRKRRVLHSQFRTRGGKLVVSGCR